MEVSEKLYCVFDKVSGNVSHFCSSTSDGLAVRTILLSFQVPLKDSVVLCFGELVKTFADDNMESTNLDWSLCLNFSDFTVREVPWSSYKFPSDVADALAPLGASDDEIREVLRNKQAEILAKD